MPRRKITNKRLHSVLMKKKQEILANPNYEFLLHPGIASSDYLRRRAMEFLNENNPDNALDMLILDKILA